MEEVSLVGVAYLRRSVDSGTGVSEDIQDESIREVAERLGIEVRYWLPPDLDASSFTMERPSFQRALLLLAEGEANRLIVAKLNRLTRRRKHWEEVLDLAEEQGWKPVSAEFPDLDLLSDSGRMIAGFFIDQGEREYRERRRDGDSSRRNAVLRHGVHGGGGVAPFGYEWTVRGYDKKGRPQRGPLAPTADAPRVRAAFEARAEGASLAQVARILGAKSRSATVRVLSNRVYLGEARSGEYVKAGAHPALVDEAVFSRVQRRLEAAAKDRTQTRRGGKALLQKVLRCGRCGATLSPEGGGYRCHQLGCSRLRIAAGLIEPYVLDLAVGWHAAQFPQYDALRQADDALLPALEDEHEAALAERAALQARKSEFKPVAYAEALTLAERAVETSRRAVEDAEAGQGWLGLTPERLAEKLGLRFEEYQLTTPGVEALGTSETTTSRRRVVAAEAAVETVNGFITDMIRVIVRPVGRGRRLPINQRVQVLYLTAGRTASGDLPEPFLDGPPPAPPELAAYA